PKFTPSTSQGRPSACQVPPTESQVLPLRAPRLELGVRRFPLGISRVALGDPRPPPRNAEARGRNAEPNPRHFTLGGEKSQIDTGDLHAPMVQTLSFMPVSRFRGLWLKIALPVLGFTMLGSLVLLYWLHTAAERES